MKDAHSLSDEQWLEAFEGQWHFLADLSFSDLVLWLPTDETAETFECKAQIRPVTGPTALEDDVVGERIGHEADHPVVVAWMSPSFKKMVLSAWRRAMFRSCMLMTAAMRCSSTTRRMRFMIST